MGICNHRNDCPRCKKFILVFCYPRVMLYNSLNLLYMVTLIRGEKKQKKIKHYVHLDQGMPQLWRFFFLIYSSKKIHTARGGKKNITCTSIRACHSYGFFFSSFTKYSSKKIHTATKIYALVHVTTPHNSIKFHCNQFTTF